MAEIKNANKGRKNLSGLLQSYSSSRVAFISSR